MDKSIDTHSGIPWHGAGINDKWGSEHNDKTVRENDPIVQSGSVDLEDIFYIKCAENLYENITEQIVQKNPGVKFKPKWSDCPQDEKDMWITAVEQTLPGIIEHVLAFTMSNMGYIGHVDQIDQGIKLV